MSVLPIAIYRKRGERHHHHHQHMFEFMTVSLLMINLLVYPLSFLTNVLTSEGSTSIRRRRKKENSHHHPWNKEPTDPVLLTLAHTACRSGSLLGLYTRGLGVSFGVAVLTAGGGSNGSQARAWWHLGGPSQAGDRIATRGERAWGWGLG